MTVVMPNRKRLLLPFNEKMTFLEGCKVCLNTIVKSTYSASWLKKKQTKKTDPISTLIHFLFHVNGHVHYAPVLL